MSELTSILIAISTFAGEVQLISMALDEKYYSPTKRIMMWLYLLVGINVPMIGYGIFYAKTGTVIPVISLLLDFYIYGLCIIGITTFLFDYYKLAKKKLSVKKD